MFRAALIISAMTALLTGCIPVSLSPLYLDSDKGIDPRLLGLWKDRDGEIWEFVPGEPDPKMASENQYFYQLSFTDQEGATGTFSARLTRCGDITLLDVAPAGLEMLRPGNDLDALLHVPVHTWLKLEIGKSVKLSPPSAQWLETTLSQQPDNAELLRLKERWPLLVDSTQELRGFVTSHASDPEFFSEPIELRHATSRVRPGHKRKRAEGESGGIGTAIIDGTRNSDGGKRNSGYDSTYRQAPSREK